MRFFCFGNFCGFQVLRFLAVVFLVSSQNANGFSDFEDEDEFSGFIRIFVYTISLFCRPRSVIRLHGNSYIS